MRHFVRLDGAAVLFRGKRDWLHYWFGFQLANEGLEKLAEVLLLIGSQAGKSALICEVGELQFQKKIRKRLVLKFNLLFYLFLRLLLFHLIYFLLLNRSSRVLQADLARLNHGSHLFILYLRNNWPCRKSDITLFNCRLLCFKAFPTDQRTPPPLPQHHFILLLKTPAEYASKITSTRGSLQKHRIQHLLFLCTANRNKALLYKAVLPKALLSYCLTHACLQVDLQLLSTL